MIILHERAVILLTRSEVLNIATRATVSDKNVKCKQSEKRVLKEKITPKLFLVHQNVKEMMEISVSK